MWRRSRREFGRPEAEALRVTAVDDTGRLPSAEMRSSRKSRVFGGGKRRPAAIIDVALIHSPVRSGEVADLVAG